MTNITNFPDRGIASRPTAKQFAGEMLKYLSDQSRTDAENRFQLANMLMLCQQHINERKAFSIDEIIDCVIDGRSDVYSIAESHLTD